MLFTALQFSTLVEVRLSNVGWLVSESVRSQISWITALRIFLIFCMNVHWVKGKKRTRRFFRKNSSSLIIHENVFWPYFGHFLKFRWFILPEIVNLDRLDGSSSVNCFQGIFKGH